MSNETIASLSVLVEFEKSLTPKRIKEAIRTNQLVHFYENSNVTQELFEDENFYVLRFTMIPQEKKVRYTPGKYECAFSLKHYQWRNVPYRLLAESNISETRCEAINIDGHIFSCNSISNEYGAFFKHYHCQIVMNESPENLAVFIGTDKLCYI